MKKSPIPLRIISPILLLLWMGLIFCFSGQTSVQSDAVSVGLIETVIKFFMPSISPEILKSIVAVSNFFVRKGAHFSIFAILGVLSFLTVITYKKLHLFWRFLIALFISALYATSDEYHQTFISGRSGELRDVLIDSAGALFGILICLIIYSVRISKMKKKQYIELTNELQKRLHNEKLKTEELQSENKELSDELAALNSELFSLREKLSELEQPSNSEKNIQEEVIDTVPMPEVSDNEPITEPELSVEVIDAAKIIGKIILSSAEYCNKLTSLGADQSVKELVNLILGRTEVAKAEILRISALQIDQKTKQAAMESELNEAEDYFKSVMAQK